MTPRRRETPMPLEEPVRVYRIIGFSFLILTFIILGAIVFFTTKRVTITLTTKESAVQALEEVVVGGENGVPGKVATTTVSVSGTFAPKGTKEVSGTAVGTVTIKNTSGTAQPLVKTTRLLTPSNVLFRLKEGVTVPAGGSVEAQVYADVPGAGGDIAPSAFSIPGLSASRQKEVFAESTAPMIGGLGKVGVISREDVDAAIAGLREKAKQQVITSVSSASSSVVFVDIASSSVSHDPSLGVEASALTVTLRAEAVYAVVSQEDIARYGVKALQRKSAEGSDRNIEPSGAPQATIASADASVPRVSITVRAEGVSALNEQSTALTPQAFFGMNTDEVRRYALGIPHIDAVEVDFSPFWIRRVPSVSEHVKVIVRSTQ